jgi:hypothetical protein
MAWEKGRRGRWQTTSRFKRPIGPATTGGLRSDHTLPMANVPLGNGILATAWPGRKEDGVVGKQLAALRGPSVQQPQEAYEVTIRFPWLMYLASLISGGLLFFVWLGFIMRDINKLEWRSQFNLRQYIWIISIGTISFIFSAILWFITLDQISATRLLLVVIAGCCCAAIECINVYFNNARIIISHQSSRLSISRHASVTHGGAYVFRWISFHRLAEAS